MNIAERRKELNAFAEKNLQAFLFLNQGAEDYAAFRCLNLNGLPSGMPLAAQAVEKHLKAALLFKGKTIDDLKKLSHDLIKIQKEIEFILNVDLSNFNDLFIELKKHYFSRYPDNNSFTGYAAHDEVKKVDKLILRILEIMPVERKYLLRTGIYINGIEAINRKFDTSIFPVCSWTLHKNDALKEIISVINAELDT